MWIVQGERMVPLMKASDPGAPPWHSMPYQALPPIYVQNASLEIAWTRVIARRTRSRERPAAVSHARLRGFDINDPHDWMIAERLLADGAVTLRRSRRSRTAQSAHETPTSNLQLPRASLRRSLEVGSWYLELTTNG